MPPIGRLQAEKEQMGQGFSLRWAQRSCGKEASGPQVPGHLLQPKPMLGPVKADPSAKQCHSKSMRMTTCPRTENGCLHES